VTLRSGLGSQVMMAPEVTYGTIVTPTRSLEHRSETLTENIDRINAEGIRRGSRVRRTGRWVPNRKGGAGAINFELASKGFGLPLKHAMGSSVITTPVGATNARQHRMILGDLDDLSLTVQKGIPDTDTGTVQPFTFAGVVVTEFELSVDVDGLVLFTPTLDAQSCDTATALAAPAYPADDRVFGYQDCLITIDGADEEPTSFSLSVGHGLKTDRYYVSRTTLKRRPLVADHAAIGGTITLEFENMAGVNRWRTMAPGLEVPLTFSARGDEIDAGVNWYELKGNMPAVRFEGEMPTVSGPDVVTLTQPFVVLDNETDEPLTLDYITTDLTS
jgi:hypothetical protein